MRALSMGATDLKKQTQAAQSNDYAIKANKAVHRMLIRHVGPRKPVCTNTWMRRTSLSEG